jgi:hypothetical protein
MMVFHLPLKLTLFRACTLAKAGSARAADESASSRAGATIAGQRRKCEPKDARLLWSGLMATVENLSLIRLSKDE